MFSVSMEESTNSSLNSSSTMNKRDFLNFFLILELEECIQATTNPNLFKNNEPPLLEFEYIRKSRLCFLVTLNFWNVFFHFLKSCLSGLENKLTNFLENSSFQRMICSCAATRTQTQDQVITNFHDYWATLTVYTVITASMTLHDMT